VRLIASGEIEKLDAAAAADICEALAPVDKTWSARLRLIFNRDTPERTPIVAAVARAAIAQARRVTSFPDPASADAVLAWARRPRAGKDSLDKTGARLAAIWPVLSDPASPELIVEILKRATNFDWMLGEEEAEAQTRKRRYVAAFASSSFEVDQAARGALALVQHYASHAAASARRAADAERKAKELIDINASIASDRARLRVDTSRLSDEVAKLRSTLRSLERELDQLRSDAQHREAAVTFEGVSELNRLRGRVSRVLQREVEELRLYLDRPEPNAEGAMTRVAVLERLIDELKGGVHGA
jgi:hypothetical protein